MMSLLSPAMKAGLKKIPNGWTASSANRDFTTYRQVIFFHDVGGVIVCQLRFLAIEQSPRYSVIRYSET